MAAGQYRISATWWAVPGWATNAQFTAKGSAAGPTLGTYSVNQGAIRNDRTDSGSIFQELGVVNITGSSLLVQLATQLGTLESLGYVVADAVRIEKID